MITILRSEYEGMKREISALRLLVEQLQDEKAVENNKNTSRSYTKKRIFAALNKNRMIWQ